jgi:hypothetical protein
MRVLIRIPITQTNPCSSHSLQVTAQPRGRAEYQSLNEWKLAFFSADLLLLQQSVEFFCLEIRRD